MFLHAWLKTIGMHISNGIPAQDTQVSSKLINDRLTYSTTKADKLFGTY